VKYSGKYFQSFAFLLLGLLAVTSPAPGVSAADLPAIGPGAESHRELILEWRQKRNERLASDFG
jgi:hypothetical protein